MKVLLDESLPHALRLHILGHEVTTVVYAGWSGLKNGQLMAAAEAEGFEVFVTGDKNIPHQQNLANCPLAIVILPSVDWNLLKNCNSQIRSAVDGAGPGSISFVEC